MSHKFPLLCEQRTCDLKATQRWLLDRAGEYTRSPWAAHAPTLVALALRIDVELSCRNPRRRPMVLPDALVAKLRAALKGGGQ